MSRLRPRHDTAPTTTRFPVRLHGMFRAPALLANAARLALVVLLAGAHAAGAQEVPRFLAADDIKLYGIGLKVEPATQVVPRDIATIVSAYLQVPGAAPADVPQFAADAEVVATLRGPSLPQPVELRTKPNTPFNIPAFGVAGIHTLENIRLVSGGEVLLRGTPEIATIEVIDKLLVTQVTARPLTADEIRERGIVFDRDNFQAYNFTAAFAVQTGQQIQLNFPVLLPTLDSTQDRANPLTTLEAINVSGPSLRSLQTIIPDTLRIQAAIPNLQVVGFSLKIPQLQGQNLIVPPIPGVVVIPGDIGFLNQYFSVLLMVGNVAPTGSNLVVSDLRATILLPPGDDTVVGTGDDPLKMAQLTDGQAPTERPVTQGGPDGKLGTADDILTLGPGQSGNAEFLVEGRREGSHVIEMALSGVLHGLPVGPVNITGRAAGAVLVRNPKFTLTFTHPEIVTAGEAYTLDVTVTNTSESPANFVSVNLAGRHISGATLVGAASQSIEAIVPGDSATVSFDLVAQVTGKVTAATLAGDEHLSGRFEFKTAVGELGIPLSPDSLVLPTEARALPKPLRDAALGLLGRAYAVATAPAAALPPDVTRFSRQVVIDRAIDLAEAGFRDTLHEPLADNAAQVLFDFAGSTYQRLPERITRPDDLDFAQRNARGFDELRRRSRRGDHLADVIGSLLAPSFAATTPAAFHAALASKTSFRPAHLSVLLTANGGQVPVSLALRNTSQQRTGLVDATGKVEKAIPFSDVVPIVDAGGVEVGRLLLVTAPAGDYAIEVRPLASATPGATYSMSVVLPAGDDRMRQVVFDGVAQDRVPVLTRLPGDPHGLSVDVIGTAAPVTFEPTAAADVVDPAPTVLGVVQLGKTDAVTFCAGEPPVYPGRILGVLFSEEVSPEAVQDKALAADITRFAVNGVRVVGVALQPGRRIAFVALAEGVGPFVPRTLTITDVTDRRNQALGTQALPIEVTVTGAAGVVSGKVIGADGAPLGSAELRLLYMRQCGDEVTVVGITSKSADNSGAYSFDYVLGGVTTKVIAVDPATDEFRAISFQVQREGQRINANIVLLGRGTVEGRTLSEDGQPLPNTSIRITSLTDNSQYGARSDAQGTFRAARVPVGPVLIEAVNTTRRAQVSVSDVVPSAAAVVMRDLVLLDAVRPPGQAPVTTATMNGLVLLSDSSAPVVDAPVYAYYQDNSQPDVRCPAGPTGARPPECPIAAVRTSTAGQYEFLDLPSGSYRLVSFDAGALAQGQIATVVAANQTSTANILLIGGLGTVTGIVIDPSGAPVANARVGGGLSLTSTGADGRFTLTDVPIGTQRIVAVSDAFQSKGETEVSLVRAGDTAGATIVLEAFGSIAGTILLPNGLPASGVQVYAFYKEAGSAIIVGQTSTDDGGRYRMDNLPLHGYRVSAFTAGFTQGNVVPATIAAFRQVARVDFRMRGQGVVKGTVLDSNGTTPLKAMVGISGDQVQIAGGRVGVGFARVDNFAIAETSIATGAFSFGSVFEGGFIVRAVGQFSPDPVAFEGTLPGAGQTANVTLRLQATSVITGTIVEPNGVTPAGADVIVRYKSASYKTTCASGDSGEETCTSIPQGIQSEIVTTDANGRFVVPLVNAGPFTLDVEEPAGPGRTTLFRGSVKPGETGDFTVRLRARASIVVKVYEANPDTSGNPVPVPGARVDLTSIEPRRTISRVAGSAGAESGVLRVAGGDAFSEGEVVAVATDLRSGFVGRASGRIADTGNEITITVFIANQTGTVAGTVFGPDTITPVPNAEVIISRGGQALAFAVTDADGAFSESFVPLGDFSVEAFDAATAARGATTGRIELSGQTATASLSLSAFALVRGRVLEAGSLVALKGWQVSLSQTLPSGRQVPTLTTTAGVDGSYSFPGATLGTFTVRAARQGIAGQGQASSVVDRPGQLVEVPVVVTIQQESSATLSGLVVDPNGTPVSSAQVVINGPVGRRELSAGLDGTFTLPDLALGRYAVFAKSQNANDGGTASADLRFNQETAEVVVVLRGLSRVTGTVLQNGVPARDITVRLDAQPAGGCQGICQTTSDQDGRFAFEKLAATRFTVTAVVPNSNLKGSASDEITPGDTRDVTVVIEPSASLSGLVTRQGGTPAPQILVELNGNGRRLFIESGADGRFTFPALPTVGSRTYTLAFTDPIGPGVARRTVELVGDTEISATVLDEAAPAVGTTTPANGVVGAPRSSPITIEFTEPVDLSTITADHVQVLDPSGAPIAATRTPSNGNRTIAVTPLSLPLADQARFTIRVANVKDVIGKVMAAPFIGSFTTEDITAPQVSEITPGPDTTGAALSAPIRVRYNEPIDPARFTGPAIAMRVGATPVAGRIDVILGNTVVVFTPNLPLVEDTVYQVQVQAATDPAGNTQPQPLSYTFATTDRTAPQISSLVAAGDATVVENTVTSVVASAGSADVAVVDFFINDQPALASRAVPFTLSFKALPSYGQPGSQIKVTAAATDTSGNRGPFATTFVTVKADQVPGVTITAPAPAATYRNGDLVTVSVRGTDDVGVAQIAYRAATGDPRHAATRTVTPATTERTESFSFEVPANAAPGAPLRIDATVVDTKGQIVEAAPLTVSVLDGVGPTVSITGVSSGVRVRPGSSVSVVVVAEDAGLVSRIDFSVSGVTVRSERRDLAPAQASAATTFSFVVPANATPSDRAFLNAVAYDVAGNQTAAAQVILPVSDTVPPQITSFTTPSGRLDMVPGQPASVTVTATDEIGVTRVVLSAAGAFTFSDSASTTPLGEVSKTFTFTVPASVTAGQTVTFTARAVDVSGNQSAPATLTLTARVVGDVTLPTSEIVVAGESKDITVELAAAAGAGGQVIDLTSSAATVASVPSFVVVAAGQTSTTFALEGVSGGSATIRASIDGVERASMVATIRGGVVRGRVVSPTFEPVAGADVTITSGAVVTTQTLADGTFFVEGVAGPGVQVRALDPVSHLLGYASGSMNRANGFITLADVVLVNAGTFTGTVTTAQGQSAGAGVQVDLYAASNGSRGALQASTFTGDGGTFAFQLVSVGSYWIEAGDTDGNRGRTIAAIPASGDDVPVTVTYLARATVSGVVSSAAGQPVNGAQVTLRATSIFGSATARTMTTVTGGTFTFDRVLAGSFTVDAVDPVTQTSGEATGVVVTDGVGVSAPIQLSSFGTVTGTVFRYGGTEAVGAGVSVTLSGAPSRTTQTDAQGRFTFTFVPLGSYGLTASEPTTRGRGTATVTLSQNLQTAEQAIAFVGQGTVVVTVTNANGQPIQGASATARSTNAFGQSVDELSGTTGANGQVVIERLRVSEGLVAAASANNLSGQTVTLAGLQHNETRSVTVSLQPTATITGTIYRPNGQTPAADGTVTLNPGTFSQKNIVLTEAAAGVYRFEGLPLSTYTLRYTDANGRIRAVQFSVQLSQNNEVVTRDMTMVGLGTVTGRVSNPDNSSASGLSVTVSSNAPNVGGSWSATTNASGIYSVSNVPVGAIVATTGNAALNLLGEATGTLATDLQTLTLDIVLQTSAVNLPLGTALRDAFSTIYTVQRDGGITGPASVTTSLPRLSVVVNGAETPFTGSTIGQYEDGRREVAVKQDNVAGLNITRKIYVPLAGYFARITEFVTNPTEAPVTLDLRIAASPRPSGTMQVPFTSSGDTTIDQADAWVVIDDSNEVDPQYSSATNLPPLAFVSGGANARDALDVATWTPSGTVAYTRTFQSVTIPAGGRVALMHFVVPHYSRPAARAAAERLVQLPPEALAAMTTAEAADIVNFDVPPTLTSALDPAPATTGRVTGTVFEGDATTVVPSPKVTLRSSFEPLARDVVVTATSLGVFDVASNTARPMPLAPMTVSATHPDSAVVSPSLQADLSVDQPVATLTVPFTGTAVVDVTVTRGIDGTVVPGGQVTSASARLATGNYAKFKALDAQGKARYSGVPLAADGAISFQITSNHQQGTALTSFVNATAVVNAVTPVSLTTNGGVITGVVTFANGQPAAGLTVKLADSMFSFPTIQRFVTTDANGRFTSTDMPLGSVLVIVTHPTNGTVLNPSFIVQANAITTADVAFPKRGTVSMTLRRANGAVMGGDATLLQNFTTIRSRTTIPATGASAGSLSFTNLPMGTYTLSVRPGGADILSESFVVTLAEDGEVSMTNVAARPFGRVVGTVKRPDGSIPNVVSNLFNIRAGTDYVAYDRGVDGTGSFTQDFVPAGVPVNIDVRYPSGFCCTERKANIGGPIVNDGDEIRIDALTPARATLALTVTSGGIGQVVGVAIEHPINGYFESKGNTNASGQITIPNVGEGTYRVRLTDPATNLTIDVIAGTVASLDDGTTLTRAITIGRVTGTITGRVVSQDGHPLATGMVNVRLAAADGSDVASPVQTDSTGRFTFANVSVSVNGAIVRPELIVMGNLQPAINAERAATIASPGATTDLGDVVLPVASVTITGRVTDSAGTAIPGLTMDLSFSAQSGLHWLASTVGAADGTYAFGPIMVPVNGLLVGASGYSRNLNFYQELPATVVNGTAIVDFTIDGRYLQVEGSLQASADASTLVPRAEVELRSSEGGYLAWVEVNDGTFSAGVFTNVTLSGITVRATGDPEMGMTHVFDVSQTFEIQPTDAGLTANVVIPASVVKGNVRYADAMPVEFPDVFVEHADGMSFGTGKADGTYAVVGVPQGHFVLTAQDAGGLEVTVDDSTTNMPSAESLVTIDAVLGATNQVQVEVFSEGVGLAGAEVRIQGGGVTRHAVTDVDGLVLVVGLIPGPATLTVTADGVERYVATRLITVNPVDQGTSTERVDLDDAAGGVVRVLVKGLVSGSPARMDARVSLAISGVVRQSFTYADTNGDPGFVEFHNVPAGSYVVWAENDGVMQVGEEVARRNIAAGEDELDVQMSAVSEFWDTFTSDGFRYAITVDGSIFRGAKTSGYQDPFNFNFAGQFQWGDYSVCCNLGARNEAWRTGTPADGQERIYGPVHNAGLTMRRKVWVSDYNGQGFVRYYDTITNNSTTAQFYEIRIGSNMLPEVNGIMSESPASGEWVVRRNDVSASFPTWVEVFGSASAPSTPATFTLGDRSQFATYWIELMPGETKAFVRVIFQRSGVVDDFSLAEAEAAEWTSLGARMLENLTPAERLIIVNLP